MLILDSNFNDLIRSMLDFGIVFAKTFGKFGAIVFNFLKVITSSIRFVGQAVLTLWANVIKGVANILSFFATAIVLVLDPLLKLAGFDPKKILASIDQITQKANDLGSSTSEVLKNLGEDGIKAIGGMFDTSVSDKAVEFF